MAANFFAVQFNNERKTFNIHEAIIKGCVINVSGHDGWTSQGSEALFNLQSEKHFLQTPQPPPWKKKRWISHANYILLL